MKKNSGFTLIELMMTMALVGILMMVGVPSLKTFMQGNQLVASTNELVSALHIARSEAIKLNTRVSICSSNDGASCSGDANWKDGWVVFVDANGGLDNTGAACDALGTDCLLRSHDGFTDNQITLAGVDNNTDPITSFTFSSRGLPKAINGASQSGIYSVCSLDSNGATVDSRAVVLSLSGRVRASSNTTITACPPSS